MSDENLIVSMLREIKDDIKETNASIAKLSMDHKDITNELRAGRNGFNPHEIVEMLHWVKKQMTTETKTSDKIREKIIDWSVPLLLGAFFTGVIVIAAQLIK